MPKNWKGDPLGVFQHPFCRKTSKNGGGKIFIFGKKSHNSEKKLKGGTVWDFSTSILSQNSKKIERGPFGKFFSEKKVSQCRKKIERGLARYGMLRRKTGKTFLVQFARPNFVQFGAIIFCRTFKNYFGQYVWIEKKKSHFNIRVSLHEAPTKKGIWVVKSSCSQRGTEYDVIRRHVIIASILISEI